MLLGNGLSAISMLPVTFVGYPTGLTNPGALRTLSGKDGARYGRTMTMDETASIPDAAEPPTTWIMAVKGSRLAADDGMTQSNTTSSYLNGGVNMQAALAQANNITAALSLIANMQTAMVQANTTTAAMQMTLNLAANLAQNGDLPTAMGLIAWCSAAINGGNTLAVNLFGTLSMSADMTSAGDVLSAANVGPAVWNTRKDTATDPTTFGGINQDTYQAKVWLSDDNVNTLDRYMVVWFKNGEPVLTGITAPKIQVIKAFDASDLVAVNTAMTAVGSTGIFKYDEAVNRIVDGAGYVIKVTAVIDSLTRTFFQPVSRDS